MYLLKEFLYKIQNGFNKIVITDKYLNACMIKYVNNVVHFNILYCNYYYRNSSKL